MDSCSYIGSVQAKASENPFLAFLGEWRWKHDHDIPWQTTAAVIGYDNADCIPGTVQPASYFIMNQRWLAILKDVFVQAKSE